MSKLNIILLAVSAVLLALGAAGYAATRKGARAESADKKQKKKNRLFLALLIFSLWLMFGTVISSFYHGKTGINIEFTLFSERVTVFNMSFAKTTVVMWIITAIVTVLALVFRIFVFPRFSPDSPKGIQNIMELSVEAMESFAKSNLKDYSDQLAPYMYSLAVFMVGAAISELFGTRPPTSDIVVTFAMGLITFVLINFYGIRKKGLGGRIKGMMQPNPVMLPMKIISDVAVPVSLACRLFGNMLGGMIVMDLLKSVLGGYGSGLPAVAGLYFNLFHPLIQTYIFVILSMTFINEAIE